MLFQVILLIGFLLRLTRFDFPLSYIFFWGDGTRDFLVANHILKYGEFPLTGPFNLLNDAGVHNSPIYFYVLSLFLVPFNNILTLSFVNILLQLGVIVLVFLISRRLFDYSTAIIAVLLFSFNPEVIKQADFVWQPHLMLPFALLALYLSLKSHKMLSLAVLSFSAVLHNSAFCWMPMFLLSQKKSANYYIKALSLTTVILLILYLPLLIFYLKNGLPTFSLNVPTFASSFMVYFSNLTSNMGKILSAYYLNNIFMVFLLIGFFIVLKIDRSKRNSLVFILLLFIIPIISASFFNKIRLHYIILSQTLLLILIARTTVIFRPLARSIVALILLVILSGNFAYYSDFKLPLVNSIKVKNLTELIISELNNVRNNERFSDYNFFKITSYSKEGNILPYPILDTVLLTSLEDKLSIKLTQVSDQSPYNHIQTNRGDYILLSCFGFNEDKENCQNTFKVNLPSYNISKMIYNDGSIGIYLAKNGQI